MARKMANWLAPSLVAALAVGPIVGGCASDTTTTDDTTAVATPDTGTPETEPPTTEPPATEPPTTEPPATDPPATEPPTTEPPATDPPTTEPPTTDAPATDPQVASTLVNVYWAWTVLNPAGGSPERIGAGARMVPGDTPVRNALEAMFAGTNSIEEDIGMISLIPAGTRVLGIAVDGDTATVDLSGEFENTIGGTLAESMQLAEVVFTVTQFDGFERVKFHIDGEPRDMILSHGFVVGDGLTRDDFADIRARLMLESPYPGQDVGNSLVLRGESNTFEATVEFTVLTGGGDGIVVMNGFTTATAGNGEWGTFEAVIDLDDYPDTYQPGPGSILLFESSARDGTPLDIVETPINLPER